MAEDPNRDHHERDIPGELMVRDSAKIESCTLFAAAAAYLFVATRLDLGPWIGISAVTVQWVAVKASKQIITSLASRVARRRILKRHAHGITHPEPFASNDQRTIWGERWWYASMITFIGTGAYTLTLIADLITGSPSGITAEAATNPLPVMLLLLTALYWLAPGAFRPLQNSLFEIDGLEMPWSPELTMLCLAQAAMPLVSILLVIF